MHIIVWSFKYCWSNITLFNHPIQSILNNIVPICCFIYKDCKLPDVLYDLKLEITVKGLYRHWYRGFFGLFSE